MKTIDINLIGELGKAPEYNKQVIKKDNLDYSAKILVIVFLVVIFVVFIASFGLWFITDSLGKKHSAELKILKTERKELVKKQTELSIYKKNLQKQLEIAEFKLLAKQQINNSFIPWSNVLKELASKIPRKIIISDIDKTGSRKSSLVTNRLSISGIVPLSKNTSVKPFTAVSFLILNINEDNNSLLTDAEIKKIELNPETNVYEFQIETNIRKNQDIKQNKKD